MEHPIDERREQRAERADLHSLLIERSRRRFAGLESVYTPPAPEAA